MWGVRANGRAVVNVQLGRERFDQTDKGGIGTTSCFDTK